jgi:hypothetical protein
MSDDMSPQDQVREQLWLARLGSMKAAHDRVVHAIETIQPRLMAPPVSGAAEVPIEWDQQYRFTELMNGARKMASSWRALAREYESMAEFMRDYGRVDEAGVDLENDEGE